MADPPPICELTNEEASFMSCVGTALRAMLAKERINIIDKNTTPIFERVFILPARPFCDFHFSFSTTALAV